MRVSQILLAGLIGFSAVLPANAGGSMSREVSVIIVHPTREIRAMNEANRIRKEIRQEQKNIIRVKERLRREEIRDQKRRAAAADKAYAKKLEAQRKARKK